MVHFSRKEEALVALGATPSAQATPVQAVKLLFLMEKRVPNEIGGVKYNFTPYDYGPFDSQVYSDLEDLGKMGLVEVIYQKPRLYRLTTAGQQQASNLLARMDPHVSAYIQSLAAWVTGVTFAQLVSAIYNEFPEMRANSIFQG